MLDEGGGIDGNGDEESGINTGRLYGICVLHPRLLTANGADFEASGELW